MKIYVVYTTYIETYSSPYESEWERRERVELVTRDEEKAKARRDKLGWKGEMKSYDVED